MSLLVYRGGKPQVERPGGYITKGRHQTASAYQSGQTSSERKTMAEDNSEKDINHSVGQDPFRVPPNHFRDASSPPLPPCHHLSEFVESSAQHSEYFDRVSFQSECLKMIGKFPFAFNSRLRGGKKSPD